MRFIDCLLDCGHAHLVTTSDHLLFVAGNISPSSLHDASSRSQQLQVLGGMERRQYHSALASHLLSKGADEQLIRIEEILWQLEIAGDYVRLSNMLIIPRYVFSQHTFCIT